MTVTRSELAGRVAAFGSLASGSAERTRLVGSRPPTRQPESAVKEAPFIAKPAKPTLLSPWETAVAGTLSGKRHRYQKKEPRDPESWTGQGTTGCGT